MHDARKLLVNVQGFLYFCTVPACYIICVSGGEQIRSRTIRKSVHTKGCVIMTNNQQVWDFSSDYKNPKKLMNAVEEVVGSVMPLVAATRMGTALGATAGGRVLMSALPGLLALGAATVAELVYGASHDT